MLRHNERYLEVIRRDGIGGANQAGSCRLCCFPVALLPEVLKNKLLHNPRILHRGAAGAVSSLVGSKFQLKYLSKSKVTDSSQPHM